LQRRAPAAETNTLTPPARLISPGYYASHWRSLDYFNLYRLTLSAALLLLALLGPGGWPLGEAHPAVFRAAALVYLASGALFVLTIRAHWPAFHHQLTLQIITDVVLLSVMSAASGGLASGLPLLLIISLASGGLVQRSQLVMFYASLASLAVLLTQLWCVSAGLANAADFLPAGLLSMGFFAMAWLGHSLTQRALVSEQLAAEQGRNLARLQRIHTLVAGDSAEGILAFDAQGGVFYANPRAHALLGWPTDGLLHDIPAALELAHAAWKEGHSRPLRVDLPAGHCQLRYSPLEDEPGVVMLLEDLSRAEAAAQQIKLAALGRLTLNIAHEIRNPLSAIRQSAQLLGEEVVDMPVPARLAKIIDNHVTRLDRLVEDVLTVNRRDRRQPVTLQLQDWLGEWLNEWRTAENIPETSATFRSDGAHAVCFDPGHLRQILWNLAQNAWRYGSHGPGALRIQLQRHGPELWLDIRDDGPGISAADRSRLFEPFFTTDTRGTGLGLYIARELAESNAARLEYQDTGHGACFRLLLKEGRC
jgi:two-component system sensor histidine kinase PilS (NtrC family)